MEPRCRERSNTELRQLLPGELDPALPLESQLFPGEISNAWRVRLATWEPISMNLTYRREKIHGAARHWAYKARLLAKLRGELLPRLAHQPNQRGANIHATESAPNNFDLSGGEPEMQSWRKCSRREVARDAKCAPLDRFRPFEMLRFYHLAVTFEGIMGNGREILNVNRHREIFMPLRRAIFREPLYFVPSLASVMRRIGSTSEGLHVFWGSLRFLVGSTLYGATSCADGFDFERSGQHRIRHLIKLLNPLQAYASNFYHFLFEIMPMILLSLPWLSQDPTLRVLMYNISWAFDFLSLIGIPMSKVEVFHPCSVYLVDQVFVPLLQNTASASNFRGWLAPHQLAFVRRAIFARVARVHKQNLSGERLHVNKVSRDTALSLWLQRSVLDLQDLLPLMPCVPPSQIRVLAKARFVENARRVLHILQKAWRNVSRIIRFEPQSQSVVSQLTHFRRAASVIGIEGAHFSNIIWCARGTLVVLLMTSSGGDSNWCGCGYFQRIASSLALQYYVAQLENFGAFDSGIVPTLSFTRFLQEIPAPRRSWWT